nr:hypothetical protein BIN_B_01864 [Mycolicibacterium smegmatis]
MDGVGTSIIGRPRPLSRHRRADDLYTLNCEEPVWLQWFLILAKKMRFMGLAKLNPVLHQNLR